MTTEDLTKGQVLLTQVKGRKNGKVEFEIAEIVTTSSDNNTINSVSLFNASDDRFSKSKPRRAWMIGEATDIAKHLNLNVEMLQALAEGETKELNVLNPFVTQGDNKFFLRVQIVETTVPTAYQLDPINGGVEKFAKRTKKDGPFILNNGKYIFSDSKVALLASGVEPVHTILAMDKVEQTINAMAEAAGIVL